MASGSANSSHGSFVVDALLSQSRRALIARRVRTSFGTEMTAVHLLPDLQCIKDINST